MARLFLDYFFSFKPEISWSKHRRVHFVLLYSIIVHNTTSPKLHLPASLNQPKPVIPNGVRGVRNPSSI